MYRDQTVIRWRYEVGLDGNAEKESNARMVRWSDGSETLHVGGDVLWVNETPMTDQHQYLFARHQGGMQ